MNYATQGVATSSERHLDGFWLCNAAGDTNSVASLDSQFLQKGFIIRRLAGGTTYKYNLPGAILNDPVGHCATKSAETADEDVASISAEGYAWGEGRSREVRRIAGHLQE